MDEPIQNRLTVQGSSFRDEQVQNRLTVQESSLREVTFAQNKPEKVEFDTQIFFIDQSSIHSSDQCIKGNLERVSEEKVNEDDGQQDPVTASVCSQVCGMLIFCLSMIVFSFLTMLIKITISKFGITAYELTYYQSIVCLVYMSINLKIHKQDLRTIPSNCYSTVVLRVFFGVITDVFINMSFQYTSYSKAMCIFFLSTIMIPFVAICILGDKVRKLDIVAIIISFVGMFLIIQPFGNHADIQNYESDLLGVFIAFLGAIGSALAIVFQKKLADSLHFTQVNLSYMISSSLICPVFSFVSQRKTYPAYSVELFLYVLAIGTCFFIMMVLMTISMKRMKASVSGILLYICIPTSYLFDYAFLHTSIGSLEILGAAIIVGTNVGVAILVASGCAK